MRNFLRDTRGLALLEFVFIAPVLILLVLGAVELSRYILIMQKVERAAYVLTDMITQYSPATQNTPAKPGEINETEAQAVFAQYSRIMKPYNAVAREAIIVTSIRCTAANCNGGNKVIRWQTAGTPDKTGLTTDVISMVNGKTPTGVSGTHKNDPTSFPAAMEPLFAGMANGENMVVGEVFFRYEPFMAPVLAAFGFTIAPTTISRYMFFKPRQCLGAGLPDLPPNFPVTSAPVC